MYFYVICNKNVNNKRKTSFFFQLQTNRNYTWIWERNFYLNGTNKKNEDKKTTQYHSENGAKQKPNAKLCTHTKEKKKKTAKKNDRRNGTHNKCYKHTHSHIIVIAQHCCWAFNINCVYVKYGNRGRMFLLSYFAVSFNCLTEQNKLWQIYW